jgi:hypothetical protein
LLLFYLYKWEMAIMNFINTFEGLETRLELKYCERCGGLFLRQPANSQIYCSACAQRFQEQLNTRELLRGVFPRKPRRRKHEVKLEGVGLLKAGHVPSVHGVAEAEVRPC